jgi:hypothetical protein
MKTQPEDLKSPLSPIFPDAGPNRHAHPNCGNQRTIHRRNTKLKAQRIEKKPLEPHRIRKITASFAFIEHRFLRDGFWSTLDQHQLLLYVFLIIVADRSGLSYYSYDKICTLLKIAVDDYIVARDALIQKDLIGFDGHLFQVLSLPDQPVDSACAALKSKQDMQKHDPATIHQLLTHRFGKKHD